MTIPGVVWLSGASRSGKTTLLGNLTRKLDPKSVFYFDHRFAHRPVHLELTMDLERFASGLGIPILNPLQVLEVIFRNNVVMIFDDLFSSDPMHEQDFITQLTTIIGFREIIGHGTIIIATASDDKDLSNWVIQIMKSVPDVTRRGKFTRIHIKDATTISAPTPIESLLAGKFGKTLHLMSLLRFAELPELLSQLCDQPEMQEALALFEQNQLIDRRGQRYVLRGDVQTAIRNSIADISALRLTLAKRFEAIAPEQPYFRRAHCAIEAEAHYWQAKEFKQALTQLLSVAEALAAAGAQYFAYSTVGDYIWDDDSKILLSHLQPELLIPFSDLTHDAYEYGILAPDDLAFIEHTVQKVVNERGEGFPELLQAIRSRRARDFDSSVEALLKAANAFRAAGNVQFLASVLFDLSVCKLENVAFSINEEVSRQALQRAQEAEELYSELGDEQRVAKARDHLATVLIHLGDYDAARKLEEKQRKVHAKAEGFTNEKGVVYGNLFSTNLALGRVAEAEAYFHQSNLNYSWVRNRRGILFNLYTLFNSSRQSQENLDRLFQQQPVSQERKDRFIEALGSALESLKNEVMKPGLH